MQHINATHNIILFKSINVLTNIAQTTRETLLLYYSKQFLKFSLDI